MDRVRKAFEYADGEGKKFLTRHEYKIAMTIVFGYCPDRLDVKQNFGGSSNPKNLISFQKFQNCVRKKIDSTCNHLLDFEYIFVWLDKKFKGYLILDDFLTAAKEVDLRISRVILENVFKELDRCRKGFIGINDFVKTTKDKK